MAGGLTCPRCAGLLIPDAEDAAYAKCTNCARSWTPERVAAPQPVQAQSDPPMVSDERRVGMTMAKWSPEQRAAHRQTMKDIWAKKRTGGGIAAQQLDGEENEADDDAVQPETCGVTGCKKPQRPGSTQCERHYQKSLRNNIKYRDKTKKALNGNGTDWKSQALSALVSQRETLTAKIHEIDTVMAAIQAM